MGDSSEARQSVEGSGGSVPHGGSVSVVVSCFNIETYVEACLASIARQTYSDFEVILVDDGSTDATAAILDAFVQTRASWTVLHKENGGLSSARNAGIAAAKGDWLVFVDGDDLLEERALELLVNAAIRTSSDLVCANHWVQSGDNRVAAGALGSETRILTQRDAFLSVLYHGDIDVSAWGKVYASSLFRDLRFPEGRIYEDTYVFDDILARVSQVTYIPIPLYCYVMRPGSIVNVTWSGRQMQFIDAADKFADHAEELYPELSKAAVRRRVHARLSVLRYMGEVGDEYTGAKRDLISYVRKAGTGVLWDRDAPMRDKLGIVLIRISPQLFSWAWSVYSRLRPDR